MTVSELRPIVAFYHSNLPGWRAVREDTLFREAGPVLQGITFERLSYGSYRPIGYIRVLVAPEKCWVFELPQHLDAKIRQIDPRAHEVLCYKVAQAIRTEFLPDVGVPLEAASVLALYERSAVPSGPEAYSLAALNAYLGDRDRALYWCSQFSSLVTGAGAWQEYDYRRLNFLNRLRTLIVSGEANAWLDRVLEDERRR